MKKLFLAICFSLLSFSSHAKVTEILDQDQIPQPEIPQTSSVKVHTITNEELTDFLSHRLKSTFMQPRDEVNTKASDVQLSEVHAEAQRNAQKGIFEKIYDAAMKRLDTQQPAPQRADLALPQF